MSDSKIQPLVTVVDNPHKEENKDENEEYYDAESGTTGENNREEIQNVAWGTKEKSQKERKRKNSEKEKTENDDGENKDNEELNRSEEKNEDADEKQEEKMSNQRVIEACQKLAEDCKELMEAIKEHDRIKAATGVASEKCERIKSRIEHKIHSIQERIARYVPSPVAKTCGYCASLLHFSVLSAISLTERLADYGCNKYKGTYASSVVDSLANSVYRNTLGYFRTSHIEPSGNSEQQICEEPDS